MIWPLLNLPKSTWISHKRNSIHQPLALFRICLTGSRKTINKTPNINEQWINEQCFRLLKLFSSYQISCVHFLLQGGSLQPDSLFSLSSSFQDCSGTCLGLDITSEMMDELQTTLCWSIKPPPPAITPTDIDPPPSSPPICKQHPWLLWQQYVESYSCTHS